MRHFRPMLAGLALLLPLAAPALAQDACVAPGGRPGDGRAGSPLLSATVGVMGYDLAGGRRSDGVEAGVEGSFRMKAFDLRGGVYRAFLGDAPADPTILRIRVSRALLDVRGVTVCAAALGGGSVVSSGEDGATTVGGGVGLTAGTRLATGGLTLWPYLGVRALGARASGDILGQDFSVSGGSLGAEGGVGASRGAVHGSLRFTIHGFDPALGATAYPAFAVRFSLGWHF